MNKSDKHIKESGYKVLKWDSDFFGFKTAHITIEHLDTRPLRALLKELKSQNIKLVYWFCDKEDFISHKAAIKENGILADEKITYGIDLSKNEIKNNTTKFKIDTYNEKTTNNDLIKLAIQSGIYSRFNFDKKFSSKLFRQLYKRWIVKSVDKIMAKEILIVKEKKKITGMVTVGEKNHNMGAIGLIAVDEKYRGKGIGKALVAGTNRWFKQQGYGFAQVVTQKRNTGGCRLYESCGYIIKKTEFVYHFWL